MDSKAQTAVEYILLLAGLIAFVTVVVLLWNSRVYQPAVNSITNKVTILKNLTNVS